MHLTLKTKDNKYSCVSHGLEKFIDELGWGRKEWAMIAVDGEHHTRRPHLDELVLHIRSQDSVMHRLDEDSLRLLHVSSPMKLGIHRSHGGKWT